mmetsp:Transcript_5991/g.25062  ORF Transcript_5991/g.25062 Transcript_5991/m.25062 type:complete len:209 (+) Transcript_5991:1099-1725(+)
MRWRGPLNNSIQQAAVLADGLDAVEGDGARARGRKRRDGSVDDGRAVADAEVAPAEVVAVQDGVGHGHGRPGRRGVARNTHRVAVRGDGGARRREVGERVEDAERADRGVARVAAEQFAPRVDVDAGAAAHGAVGRRAVRRTHARRLGVGARPVVGHRVVRAVRPVEARRRRWGCGAETAGRRDEAARPRREGGDREPPPSLPLWRRR